MAKAYHEMRDLEAELSSIKRLVTEGSKEREFKAFQVQEIREAALTDGEEEELALSRARLRNSEKLSSVTGSAERTLYSEDGSVMEKLGRMVNELADLGEIDERIKEPALSLKEALFRLEDIADFLRSYSAGELDDSESLEEIEERLDLINNLKRKYDMGIKELLVRAEEIEKELADIEGFDDRLSKVESALQEVRKNAEVIAGKLTKERVAAAGNLKDAVERELKDLAMEGASFSVDIRTAEAGKPEGEAEGTEQKSKPVRISEKGADRVSFLVATNQGEELMPIEHVASGGELSRIMLAMKTSTSFGRVPTMIFDEIDTGVGGDMAKKIAAKLKGVASSSQAICITHMPQIAAYADNHYFVSKAPGADERTVTSVVELNGAEITEEITRMLGGEGTGEEIAAQHAKELLSSARSEVQI
jgi:DNA repair protein RecN (Recombination protein N)